MGFLLEETKKSRINCIEAMRVTIGSHIRNGVLTLVQTQEFYKDVYTMVILFNEVNLPDLKLWLSNSIGSQYENQGFAQKSYYSLAFKEELLDIYNGNY